MGKDIQFNVGWPNRHEPVDDHELALLKLNAKWITLADIKVPVIIYVFGKYTAPTVGDTFLNIVEAWKVARRLWTYDHAVICPHANTMLMDDTIEHHEFLDGDFMLINASDVMCPLPGWEFSSGSRKEFRFGVANKKPIIKLQQGDI